MTLLGLVGGARKPAQDDVRQQLVALLPRLRRFAIGLCRSPDDADDLVQAGVERALDNLHRWQPGTRLDSWLFRIIQNLHLDERRSKRARTAHVDLDEAPAYSAPDSGAALDRERLLDSTLRVLGGFPESERALVMLVCVEGFSYRQAAECLGIPLGTVMSRLSRTRKRLHEQVFEAAVAAREAADVAG